MAYYRVTGAKAAISGIPCLRQWKLDLEGIDTASVCSVGGMIRTAGNADWQGVAIGYGLPTFYPGEYFTFTGSDRAGQGWQSAVNGAIVSRLNIFCPTKAGRHIFYHLYFSANGSIGKGAYSVSDGSTPAPLNPKGLQFQMDMAAVNGVESWSLMIDGNLTPPTYPSHMAGWPGRDPGTPDAELTWVQTFDAMTQIPAINSFHTFRPYVDSTRFFDLQWCQVLKSPVDYPVEGNPPGQGEFVRLEECKAKFSGYNGSTLTWGGFIKKPGGAVYWS